MLALHGFKRCSGRRQRRLWVHDRGLHKPGFFYQNLLGSFNSREFKGRMRMDVSTFECLCCNLAPELQRRDTNMRLTIPVQVKIAVSITKLASSNSMQCIADLYKIGLSSSQIAISEFCVALKKNSLGNSSVGLHLPQWISMHRSSKTSTRFRTWWGLSMAPTCPSFLPDCMLQITTTAKDSIPSFCRVWCLLNVCFGISTLVGLARCTMQTYGPGQKLASFVRRANSIPML